MLGRIVLFVVRCLPSEKDMSLGRCYRIILQATSFARISRRAWFLLYNRRIVVILLFWQRFCFNPLWQLMADRPTKISRLTKLRILLEISTNVVFGELDAILHFKSFKAIHRSQQKFFTSWSSILHSKLGDQLLIWLISLLICGGNSLSVLNF